MAGLTLTATTANLKQVFAPELVNVVPSNCILQQYRDPKAPGATTKEALGKDAAVPIKWGPIDKNGLYYAVPLKVQSGQGVTATGPDGLQGSDDLDDALDMKIIQWQVGGYSSVNRQQIPYKLSSLMSNGDTKAFQSITELVMTDMKDVSYNRAEVSALHGWDGIGAILSQTVSSTTLTVIFTAASFSPAIWISHIGARVQFYNPSTGVFDMNAATDYATIVNVNTGTRTVTFTMSSAWGTNTTIPAPAANAFFKSYHQSGAYDATYSMEQPGLHLQASAVSGTTFAVDRAASGNTLTQGNTFSAGSQSLTAAFAIQCAAKLADKGMYEDLVLLCGTSGWADLNTENMTLRLFDSSYSPKEAKNGTEYITYTNNNATIRVVCHPFEKAGFALIFNPAQCLWVGSSDLTFNTPGWDGEKLFQQVHNKDKFEIRNFMDKTLFLKTPSQAGLISGIVNQS